MVMSPEDVEQCIDITALRLLSWIEPLVKKYAMVCTLKTIFQVPQSIRGNALASKHPYRAVSRLITSGNYFLYDSPGDTVFGGDYQIRMLLNGRFEKAATKGMPKLPVRMANTLFVGFNHTGRLEKDGPIGFAGWV